MIHVLLATMIAAIAPMPKATPAQQDLRNIALSTEILDRVGNNLWPAWTQAPFAIDLITANGPVEINFTQPAPSPSFPPTLEAAFPFSNGVPTIVIGEEQFTQANTPTRWSVTLLHEHFHQWQDSWPPYFRSVAALGLAPKGDGGMWMLNYPFPYTNAADVANFNRASQRLADAVGAIGTPAFSRDVRAYVRARRRFASALKPADYRYFAFQCWQEGVARYTEIMVARMASQAHHRDANFLSDDEAAKLAKDAQATYTSVLHRLTAPALPTGRREMFYAYGAAEALVLDAYRPGWRSRYLNPRMDVGAFFEPLSGSR